MRFVPLLIALSLVVTSAQETPVDPKRGAFDQVLDLYVRDGFVYYRALKMERGRLDGYINQIGSEQPDRLPKNEQIAFWLNAYDALVLQTVIDHYPIATRTKDYPQRSIRQIPGSFERLTHRVGGRMLTLDQIEQTVLSGFKDPRLYLALGRGAVGSGRLKSEMFTGADLDRQLADVASECAQRQVCVQVDRANNKLLANAIFSWREKDFLDAYAEKAPKPYANRSPVERAVLAFISPKLLQIERDTLEMNTFEMSYLPFDWSLNDLTGRGGR